MIINPAPTSNAESAADAFGQMLLAAHAVGGTPGTVFEVTERDDGHISVRDSAFYFTLAGPDTPDGQILSTVEGQVLDIGCGAGRHLASLALQHTSATGIDISAGAVQVCELRGFNAICGNIFDPPPIGTFDTFLLLGGNLGILGGPHQARQLFDTLGRMAKPGARLIGEGIGITQTTDPIHRAYQQHNMSRGMHPAQVTMRIRYRTLASPWTSLWFPQPDDLAALTETTGWRLSTVDTVRAGFQAELRWD